MSGQVSPLNQLMQQIIAWTQRCRPASRLYVTALGTMGVSLQNVDDDYYMDEDWEVDLTMTALPPRAMPEAPAVYLVRQAASP